MLHQSFHLRSCQALRAAGFGGEGGEDEGPAHPPADPIGDVSDHDGDGGESCHDDDTTLVLGGSSPNLSSDEEGADEDNDDSSVEKAEEVIDKRPMDYDDASSAEEGVIDKRPMDYDDASSEEEDVIDKSPMSPGDVMGFGGDIGGCNESDFQDETDNESTSPWEKTGDSQMYKSMRRAYLAEGKDWPPTWDDGRPDFEAYRARSSGHNTSENYITPAKRSRPVPSESGIKTSKAIKITDSQQEKDAKTNATWQRRVGLRDGKTVFSLSQPLMSFLRSVLGSKETIFRSYGKTNFHHDRTIHQTWTIPFAYRLTQHEFCSSFSRTSLLGKDFLRAMGMTSDKFKPMASSPKPTPDSVKMPPLAAPTWYNEEVDGIMRADPPVLGKQVLDLRNEIRYYFPS